MGDYLKLAGAYPVHILTLGFAYGATIVFTFFGPVLIVTAGELAPALSLIAVVFHVLAFYLPVSGFEYKPAYWIGLAVLVLGLVTAFTLLPVPGLVAATGLYAWLIGRVGCLWTYFVLETIPVPCKGRVVASSLFLAFLVLYFVNMSVPVLSRAAALAVPCLMAAGAVLCCCKMVLQGKRPMDRNSVAQSADAPVPPYFSFLLLVYVSGGFSYAGIYPYFEPFAHIDRYYNVLFYLFAMLAAGRVLDTLGRKTAFVTGVGFLSVSFAVFLLPSTTVSYLMTQTFLQAGWAFVNAFGWSFSWDMAARYQQPHLFSRGIAAMLLGAAMGAFLAEIFRNLGEGYKAAYSLLTFVPLAFSFIWLRRFPETLEKGQGQPN
ncbi:MAG TPA: hypothetical protein DHV36_15660 [Desulfobacteraceae bacterium]|nr:hypothetical protein [Desulfobacteraceae bacterium]